MSANFDTWPLQDYTGQEIARPTWFVELQYISAFTETAIAKKIAAEENLAKDIPFETRARDLDWQDRNHAPAFTPYYTFCPNAVYNSWGVNNSAEPDVNRQLGPYRNEPLDLEREHLIGGTPANANIDYRRMFDVDPSVKVRNWYDRWTVTNSTTVYGVGSRNIPSYLPDITMDDANNWDSYGIELISPILGRDGTAESSSSAFAEIRAVVNAASRNTSGAEGHRAFVNNACDLHVNVYVDPGALRTLAFITTLYEEEISKMHPVCRHPIHEGRHHPCIHYRAESNRLGLLNAANLTDWLGRDGAVGIDPGNPMTYGDEDVSNQRLEMKGTIEAIHEAIFSCQSPLELTRLLNWPAHPDANNMWGLGHEERQMNFHNYTNHLEACMNGLDYPMFVQFRQAKGSLDATDIEPWVTFCQDLVMLATRLASANYPYLPVHRWQEIIANGSVVRGNTNLSVFDLMDMMNYSPAQKNYWTVRMAKNRCYVPGDKDDEYPVEKPPRGWAYPCVDLGQTRQVPHASPTNPNPDPGTNQNIDLPDLDIGNTADADEQETANTAQKIPPRDPNDPVEKPNSKTTAEIARELADKVLAERERIRNQIAASAAAAQKIIDDQNKRQAEADKAAAQQTEVEKALEKAREEFAAEQARKRAADRRKREAEAEAAADEVLRQKLAKAREDAKKNAPPPREDEPNTDHDEDLAKALRLDTYLNNPFDGMIAPPGDIADESMTYNGFGWIPTNFNIAEWDIEDTTARIGNQTNKCGCVSLARSMRNQYPNDPLATQRPQDVLNVLRSLPAFVDKKGKIFEDQSDEMLLAIMKKWAPDYQLVIYIRVAGQGMLPGTVYRIGTHEEQSSFGKNLYVSLSMDPRKDRGHWESMKRKAPTVQ